MRGSQIVAKSLADQGLQYAFGVVGVPVIEVGYSFQSEGIKYFGCRNEQGASYSAQAVGYLSGLPGICLCVSGPGMIHGLAGIANAWANCWPMVLIAGASDISQDGRGAFQESNQLSMALPYCKYAYRVTDPTNIPYHVEKAVKLSIQGRPGPVYLEFPGDVLSSMTDESRIPWRPRIKEVILSQANPQHVQEALKLLQGAKKPLVIIGKGAGYARAEKEMKTFIELTGLPFLPTPMGKGVLDDDHPLCVGPARSTALGQSDVILLVGARTNWILHFGLPPRFQKDVKIIQIDISPEEFDNSLQNAVNLLGNIRSVMQQLIDGIQQQKLKISLPGQWKSILDQKVKANRDANEALIKDKSLPLQYYSSIGTIKRHLPDNFIYVGEGANTMDIGRTIVSQKYPRTKLDAGTYGTMGVGIPYALAAKILNPEKPIVAILGDSAFGFSCMEIETAIRYNLPLIVFIINNNGIFTGVEELSAEKDKEALEFAPTALKPETRYEKMADAFGGKGIFVKTHEELEKACLEVFKNPKMCYIVNVMIDPTGNKKPQEHSWLTKSKM